MAEDSTSGGDEEGSGDMPGVMARAERTTRKGTRRRKDSAVANLGGVSAMDEPSDPSVETEGTPSFETEHGVGAPGVMTEPLVGSTSSDFVDGEGETVGESREVESAPPGATRPRRSKRATFSRWLGRFVATVLSLAVLAAIAFGAIALANGSWEVNPILSGSMRPGLAVGGVVISERIPVGQLAVRDVIVFQEPTSPSTQIVHRIIKLTKSKSGELLINTQGDANNAPDPWTLTITGDYAYRARWSLPLIGYVAVAYENNHGLFLLGAGVVLIGAAVSTILTSRRRSSEPSPSVD